MAIDQDKLQASFEQRQQQQLEYLKKYSKEQEGQKNRIEELRNQTLDALRSQQAQGLAGALGGSAAGMGSRLVAGQQAAQSGAMAQASIENQFLAQQQAARDKALQGHTKFMEFGAKLDTEKTKKIQDYQVAIQSIMNNSRGFFGMNEGAVRSQIEQLVGNEQDPAVAAEIRRMGDELLSNASGTFARFFGAG